MNGNTQSVRFASALQCLQQGITDHVFPGAVVCVTQNDQILETLFAGRHTYEGNSPLVNEGTVYDLASLTKVLATTAMAMSFYEEGKFALDAPVHEIVPEFLLSPDTRHAIVTSRMLLAHSSGLPGYLKLYERCFLRSEILDAVHQLPLVNDPGKKTEYSDIGFILLGEMLERIAGESLQAFCSRRFFAPLKMEHTRFLPPQEWKSNIPPTEQEKHYRSKVIQGEVHDENAAAMGGIAGHAGLFGTANDVANFALCMLRGGAPIWKEETVRLFTLRESVGDSGPAGNSRALGWDTPTTPSSSGQYSSRHSFGHLGFTGTSLWVDAERGISITLVSNRTWPNRSEASATGIQRLRPMLHDAVMKELV